MDGYRYDKNNAKRWQRWPTVALAAALVALFALASGGMSAADNVRAADDGVPVLFETHGDSATTAQFEVPPAVVAPPGLIAYVLGSPNSKGLAKELGFDLRAAGIRGASLNSVEWDAIMWGAIEWDAIMWGAIEWDAIMWGAIEWDAIEWDAIMWGAIDWDAIMWGAIMWGAIDWDAIMWGAIDWDAIMWGAIDWDAIMWGAVVDDE